MLRSFLSSFLLLISKVLLLLEENYHAKIGNLDRRRTALTN